MGYRTQPCIGSFMSSDMSRMWLVEGGNAMPAGGGVADGLGFRLFRKVAGFLLALARTWGCAR